MKNNNISDKIMEIAMDETKRTNLLKWINSHGLMILAFEAVFALGVFFTFKIISILEENHKPPIEQMAPPHMENGNEKKFPHAPMIILNEDTNNEEND